jgi:alkylation response protein AidB-like acyl-CoA dehydrogenase
VRLSEDQLELQDLVRRFLQESANAEYLRKRVTDGLRFDPALVDTLRQLGLEESFAEGEGSLGFAELSVIAEEVGRALLPEPLLERVFGDRMVPQFLASPSKSAYLDLGLGTAFAPDTCCRLTIDGGGASVSGSIAWAFGVEGASRALAVVTVKGGSRVFCFSLRSAGVVIKPVTSLDLTTALSTITLTGVAGILLTDDESRVILDCYEILKASEVFGLSSRVIEMTSEYLKTREQFGVPIGAFQAVQQKIADAYAASEALGALSRFASWSVTHSPDQRPLTARAAISHASEVGPSICEAAIQCHGGIGFTWEYDLHLFLRRAKSIQAGFPLSGGRVDELLDRAKKQ